jgi:hypothetical protein
MIHELFRGLERTIHERLQMIEELVQRSPVAAPVVAPVAPVAPVVPNLVEGPYFQMARRITELEQQVRDLRRQAEPASPLIPRNPLEGMEVIPKKEVVITEVAPEPLSMADRLLLNSSARRALEEEDAEEVEDEAEVEAEAEAEAEEEEETAVVEQPVEEAEPEPDDEEDAEELEEFEYKGATYYRDTDNNVFMVDEDGELIPTPIGVWSEVKKRIIVKKPEA